MERTNVIKVIGYTPILIELCIPYFFTILQKFFAVELFSHNLIRINELERCRLIHVIVQPVWIENVSMWSPLQSRFLCVIIIRIIIDRHFDVQTFILITFVLLVEGNPVIFRMSHHKNLAAILIDYQKNPRLFWFCQNGQFFML